MRAGDCGSIVPVSGSGAERAVLGGAAVAAFTAVAEVAASGLVRLGLSIATVIGLLAVESVVGTKAAATR